MNKEIERIQDKVVEQLYMLDEHETKRDDMFKRKIQEENDSKRPSKGVLEDLNKSWENSKNITKASRMMMKFVLLWNPIMEKLNKAFDENDLIEFRMSKEELLDIRDQEMLDLITKIKSKKRWYKIDTSLRNDLLKQGNQVRAVYNQLKKMEKRIQMSPAQRSAADRASARMQMRWGF